MTIFVRICVTWLFSLSGYGWAAGDGPSCPPAAKEFSPELFQTAAARARDRGLLWRVTKDGRSSFLYGTLHVGRADWMAPGPMIKKALQETDMIALELDPLDKDVQRDLQAAMVAAGTMKLPMLLEQRLNKLMQAECLPAESAVKLRPEMQLYTLLFMSGRRDGLEPTYATEVLLALIGRASGRPVVSLETPALQLNSLLAQTPVEVETMVREGLDDLEANRARRMLLKSAQLWEDGDHEALSRYGEWCECLKSEMDRTLMKRLLDDRNPGLAESIDGFHRQGKKVFAAVGALHMIGPTGLHSLLSKRGYVVEILR